MRTPFVIVLLVVLPHAVGCGPDTSGGNVPAPSPPERGEEATPAPDPLAGDRQETVENPLYTNWSGFKKGTAVVHRSVTESAGNEAVTTTTTTYTLTDRTDDQVVVEMQASTRRYDGVEINNPPEKFKNPRRVALPSGMSKADFGKPAGVVEQGEETIELGGKQYPTRWYTGRGRNEAGEVHVKTWTSDEVPGRLVKSVTHIPAIGKTTTIELVEVKVP